MGSMLVSGDGGTGYVHSEVYLRRAGRPTLIQCRLMTHMYD